MRPLHLTVQGFACFRERQEVDFKPLDLFAISGPTGAGKSSLLDAMIYALYGKVPRVGKNYTECISLGRDRMAVTLDFRVGARTFRVTRTGRKRGAGNAQLDELVGEAEKSLAGQVREVDREIEALLGLGYEAFTQAVVLPQGEFARFLKSDPRERQKILSSLLRLDVYERMKKRAGELASSLNASVAGYQRRLLEDYAGATPEALDAARTHANKTSDENSGRETLLAVRQKTLEELKLLHDRAAELLKQRGVLQGLREQESVVDSVANRLDAARRAAPMVPLIEAAAAADRAIADVEGRRQRQRQAVLNVEASRKQCATKLEAAEMSAKDVPALEKRIRALDELKGALRSQQASSEKMATAEKEHKKLESEREVRQKELARTKIDFKTHEKAANDLTAEVTKLAFDPTHARRLDGARERATDLAVQRQALTKDTQKAGVAEQHNSRSTRLKRSFANSKESMPPHT